MAAALRPEQARAKINLTLHVRGRRADGYHALESLVVFADISDTLELAGGVPLALAVSGPTAKVSGPLGDNLVLKAAHALSARVPGLKMGAFSLSKHLPAAAGIGGGSADAAAALRLLATLNGLSLDDARLLEAARAVGADVPVCLEQRPRLMAGAGETLGPVLNLPQLHAVLVNPGVPVPTATVFARLGLAPGQQRDGAGHPEIASGISRAALIERLTEGRNDLEPAAIENAPVVAEVLEQIVRQHGCRLSRMSGSGATCFGLFTTMSQAFGAVRALRKHRADWWIQPAVLNGEGAQ